MSGMLVSLAISLFLSEDSQSSVGRRLSLGLDGACSVHDTRESSVSELDSRFSGNDG